MPAKRSSKASAALAAPASGPAVAPQTHSVGEKIAELEKRRSEAGAPPSKDAVERQHGRAKLAARERLEILLGPGSFVETDAMARHRAHGFGIEKTRPYGDGVVTGWGAIDGRKGFGFRQD